MCPRHVGGRYPTPGRWWLVTELNRVQWLFRPALSRRVHEPKIWCTGRELNPHLLRVGQLFSSIELPAQNLVEGESELSRVLWTDQSAPSHHGFGPYSHF